MVYRNDDGVEGPSIIVKQRCEKILQRFGQVVIEDITNPKLIQALEDVKKYWKDFSRPALTSFSCEAAGGDAAMSESASLMFTLASSGFGIHDDIIDKSSNKHLRMTILGLHGADTALLVGDLLMVKAWTLMHEMTENITHLTAAIFKEYGRFCVEVCEAEFMETLCRKNLETDLQYYQDILWKAMGETAACCKIGAMIGGGQKAQVEALSEFGRRVGFMSRLADDLEDCLNIKADLAHRVSYESVPLPLLYAAKSSTDRYEKIKKILQKVTIEPLDIKTLLGLCFESEAFEYVRKIGETNMQMAYENLNQIDPSPSKDVLLSIVNQSYQRIERLSI